jgi:hypothetical protein
MHTNAAALCPEFPTIAEQRQAMKLSGPDAAGVPGGRYITVRPVIDAGRAPVRRAWDAHLQAEPAVADTTVDVTVIATGVDAHMVSQQRGPVGGTLRALRAMRHEGSLGTDRFESRATMGRQAPLSGLPHTLPPRPLQTTASCRQAVQNPTP